MYVRWLLVLALAGCTGVVPDGDPEQDDPIEESFLRSAAVHGITEGSPDALGVLRVANELSQTALHADVKLTTTAARNIVAARPLATLKALDDVPYVGTTTFQHLLDYARANGYVTPANAVKTVFIILMENHNWSSIKGSSSAPYINGLLPAAAHAEGYYNPPGLHPSEPNYLWLEGGQNFGVSTDASPATNHVASHAHLAYLLDQAGISWRSYQEDIPGTTCPLTALGDYVPRHNPFVFFDDVNGAGCVAHNRPYGELAGDLAAGTVARYNFITPNLCHDMHDSCAPTSNRIRQGDDWLAAEVPRILASKAYQDGGVLFITWDEASSGDGPIGMIVLSPLAKAGYANTLRYSHSSTLRTLEEVFGVAPMLGDAANATDLSDLFREFP
jgi:phosphatidylinositol-3-phosphatase